jgi:chromosomal replication initiation ATPase DnaA
MTPRAYADAIIIRIAAAHGLTLRQVIQHDKSHAVAIPRQHVWLDVSLELGWTTTQIGRRLNRDHSTIIYGRQKAASERYDRPPKSSWPVIQQAASGQLSIARAA